MYREFVFQKTPQLRTLKNHPAGTELSFYAGSHQDNRSFEARKMSNGAWWISPYLGSVWGYEAWTVSSIGLRNFMRHEHTLAVCRKQYTRISKHVRAK